MVSRRIAMGLGFFSVGTLLVASGCGPGLGSPVKVSGTVMVNDKPLANAAITLACTDTERPPEYSAFSATTGADGAYEIAEVYPGAYEIVVGESEAGLEDPGMAGAMAEPLEPVSGELKAEVGEEDLVYDVKLKRGR